MKFTARSPTDPNKELSLNLDEADLQQGLQYGDTAGLKKLRDWFVGLQTLNHGRKEDEGWRISVGSGSQDLLYKAITAIVNRGDSVLVESPVYAGVIPLFQSLHCDQIEVETDAEGISSDSLRSILENWPVGKPKPKVLYTVPYGCNPTGMTATLKRRKEVLRLAREHDFIILEGMCFFLSHSIDRESDLERQTIPISIYAPRYPSYFALERQEPEVGRVLRFDSLSKILSAGIRIGFASGPEALLDAMDRHTATANLQVSSLTQAITFTLLDSWGYDGFIKHTENVANFYREKRDVFEAAMKKHLSGLAEWNTPEAGMFFWFKLLLNDKPDPDETGDSEAAIKTRAFERGVLALPGTVFLPNGRKTAYVRASFSLAGEEDVNEAVQRIRLAIIDSRAAAALSVSS
ncbi:uncharacterized protein LACBIDRAFT_191053 [Laccaria bicolor S238N-H82]|uniref:Predicted protein n=1 Tax=Laccaria bicolor (strain S238N-H82 / ATCC MYA-4686) TaxID=486041 RepID=B0DI10_LACBS|nr:uncharacterized protein LACBIDRAFT_191053 [Laccaria bicolor S238N-H82]EDR05824.1 predicted protein [Laccaria bicolor S238N-H82]|eukprot:XP_001883500.1 predicted protein [Laccaria bicolor S238N-H82]